MSERAMNRNRSIKKLHRVFTYTMHHECCTSSETLIPEMPCPQSPLNINVIDKQIFPHRADLLNDIHGNKATRGNNIINRHHRVTVTCKSLQAEALNAQERWWIILSGIKIAGADAGKAPSFSPHVFGGGEEVADHPLMRQAVLVKKDDIIGAFLLGLCDPDILCARNSAIFTEGNDDDAAVQAPRKPFCNIGERSVVDDDGQRHLRDQRAKQLAERVQFRLIGNHHRDDRGLSGFRILGLGIPQSRICADRICGRDTGRRHAGAINWGPTASASAERNPGRAAGTARRGVAKQS